MHDSAPTRSCSQEQHAKYQIVRPFFSCFLFVCLTKKGGSCRRHHNLQHQKDTQREKKGRNARRFGEKGRRGRWRPREARERKKFLHTATLNPQRGREQEKNPCTRSEERDVWESASKGRPVPAPRVFTGFVSALGKRRSSPLQSHLGLETWGKVWPLFR